MDELYKRDAEAILEGELEAHLGYAKRTQNIQTYNYRNGYIFPTAETQICVVHQIRNSVKYIVWKDKKEFTTDMKNIYTTPDKEAAKATLEDFKNKWNNKYSYAVDS